MIETHPRGVGFLNEPNPNRMKEILKEFPYFIPLPEAFFTLFVLEVGLKEKYFEAKDFEPSIKKNLADKIDFFLGLNDHQERCNATTLTSLRFYQRQLRTSE